MFPRHRRRDVQLGEQVRLSPERTERTRWHEPTPRQAAEALAAYTKWQVTGSPQDAPVLLGQLAASLELILGAIREAGL
jgi:hypothetical protein